MLYVIGLGLADEKDVSVRGLDAIKSCTRVFLESYTSILLCPTSQLSAFYGVEVTVADRDLVELCADQDILSAARTENVAFLVVGDPFGATTHTDLILRARELDVPVTVIHNASIMNAVGACGLQLYNFGQCVSLVFFTDSWKPTSFYDRVEENRRIGLHTLMLLDIKVKEQSIENMARGRKIYEPPRYMTVAQAATQMLETIEIKRAEHDEHAQEAQEALQEAAAAAETAGEQNVEANVTEYVPCYDESTLAIGVARIGAPDQRIVAGSLGQLRDVDMGLPLHSLVLLGSRVHVLELEYMKHYAIDKQAIQALIDGMNK